MILKDLLRRSFRMIGVLREGQTNNGDDITDAIYVLNDMLGAWNIDPLKIYGTRIDALNLVPTQQSYTIGTGGDFNIPRPEKIENANLILTSTAPPLRRPMEILNRDQWAAIKVQGVHSTLPTKLYYDPLFPLGVIYLWPFPDASYQLELFGWTALPSFASETDEVTLPNGYAEAIASNLAVRLAAEWGKELRADVAKLAVDSLAAIESHNAPTLLMDCDAGVMTGVRSGGFNRYTGELV